MALSIGSLAPNFNLQQKTSAGLQMVTLSEHFGHEAVLLLFFPFAFTGVCTEEMCQMREDFKAYTALGVKVYGISVDSPFSQEAWAEKHSIPFPLLSDFNREAMEAYDVVCPVLANLKNVAKRAAFVIDVSGKIAYSWASDDPKQLPVFEDLKKAIAAL